MQRYSILDLFPISEGFGPKEAIDNGVRLAQLAEREGYARYWIAEHHNMPNVGSAATSVLIGHIAGATSTIRVGAGGIMLPNHAPLVIAEQFGTLATIYPDRIDLGLGRAPGTDMATARALRRHMAPEDGFSQDVQELIHYLGPTPDNAKVRAIPGSNTQVPVWILGSSLYGAQLAAALGLPYAFASHFAPDHLERALALYRSQFQPSEHLDAPYAVMAMGVCAADDAEEAEFLRSSQLLTFAKMITGNPKPLQAPVEDVSKHLPAQLLQQVRQTFSLSAVGTPDVVAERMKQLNETYKPDEIMVTGMIYDVEKRLRSFEIAAQALRRLASA